MAEPTKAEKQIAIAAAHKLANIYPVMAFTDGPTWKQIWRINVYQTKDFDTEYEAALYLLKRELLR